MASCPLSFPTAVNHNRRHRATPPNYNCSATTIIIPITFCSSSSSKINLHRSFSFARNSWLSRCHATSSPSEPPPENNPPPSSGATPKDTLQIFFAVLFWMSLFFWSCAWDGGNSGKPNKGPRFRK